ncbi:MAG TPA: hypothetical protein VGR27_13925 [Longimicrobiaceae bacterium]|nr:hypothetical protein [Longimicrobiaceae bacterium]
MRLRKLAPVLLLALLAACDSPLAARSDSLAGSYVAAQFASTDAGASIDWLGRGASLQITLYENGTTTGQLFVPGADEDGSDVDADLTGTWTRSGNTVRFAHPADTFVRDAVFTASPGRLTGGYGPVQVVLEKH